MNLFNYTEWSYRTFLDEKSVVIIGGSEDARIPERGEFDVVVRVNSHVIRQGGRCDVLYHTAIPCLTVDLLESFQNDPAFVFLNLVDSDFESGARAFSFLSRLSLRAAS
jgi:hypothetical protein